MYCALPNEEKRSVGRAASWLAKKSMCSSAPLFEKSPLGTVVRLLLLRSSVCKLASWAKTSADSVVMFEFARDIDVVFAQHPTHVTVAVTSQQVGAELHANTDKGSHPASSREQKKARHIADKARGKCVQ